MAIGYNLWTQNSEPRTDQFSYKVIKKRICPMYNASDLRKGLKIQIDNEPYIIIDFQFTIG